jgi:tetratricopeptide (TPR) repeat protein
MSSSIQDFPWLAFVTPLICIPLIILISRVGRRNSEHNARVCGGGSSSLIRFSRRHMIFRLLTALLTIATVEAVSYLAESYVLGRSGPRRSLIRDVALPKKEPGEFRVLSFGESTVNSHLQGVEMVWYGAQLENRMRKAFPDKAFRFFNLGEGGLTIQVIRYRLLQAVASAEPDVVILMAGHNYGFGDLLEYNLVDRLADMTVTTRVLRRSYRNWYDTVMLQFRWFAGPDERMTDTMLRNYERAMSDIVLAASQHKVPLVLCTMASDVLDWPPEVRDPSKIGDELMERWASGETATAEKLAAQQVMSDPDTKDARLLFLAGRSLLADGDVERAHRYLVRAKDDSDGISRIPEAANEFIRSMADRNGVLLADVEQAFRDTSSQGIVGSTLIGDNCHPTPLGFTIMARTIVERVARSGLLGPGASAAIQGITWERYKEELRSDDLSKALTQYYLGTAQYILNHALMVPQHPYVFLAQQNLDAAREVAPGLWRTWYYQAALDLIEGKINEGKAAFERAVELKGSPMTAIDMDANRLVGIEELFRKAELRW